MSCAILCKPLNIGHAAQRKAFILIYLKFLLVVDLERNVNFTFAFPHIPSPIFKQLPRFSLQFYELRHIDKNYMFERER
jgi:hypothetical protein